MKKIFPALLILLFLLACDKNSTDPEVLTADFTSEVVAGGGLTTIQFRDQSLAGKNPITSWQWDFGDGQTSSEQNPQHAYQVAATFTVRLTVSDGSSSASREKSEALYKPLGNLRFSSRLTDVWGYVDTVAAKEYAIVGFSPQGFAIVDATDPAAPALVSTITTVPGFDVKVWRHYAYSVTGSGSGMGAVTNIANSSAPQVVGLFPSHHNIFISEAGYLFGEAGFYPLAIYDLNPDPTAPQLLWNGGTRGHDAAVIGNRLFDFHGSDGTYIYDISNIANPQVEDIILDPTIAYHHSGWPTKDGNYLFICDELSSHPRVDITAWDIRAFGNPQKVGQFADPIATVHNLYVIGDYAYVSYYASGFRILDVSNPTQITLAAHFDTSEKSGEGFEGAFGVYPFAPSGNIYVSDRDNGLFIFRWK